MCRTLTIGVLAAMAGSCGSNGDEGAGGKPVPHYNRDTGRLERITADRNGDGRLDTWAWMDGLQTTRIEIDRDADGRPDRWEHYVPNPRPDGAPPSLIERAEESDGRGGPVTRREFFDLGVIARVEEDTDGDGRPDKWEHYAGGALARLELDVAGRGFPSRRLIYAADGSVRTEEDPDGDGRFERATAADDAAPDVRGRGRS
jgi:hypothetical protein